MAEESKVKYNTFARTNVELYANEMYLGGVNTLEVQDYPKDNLTRITLQLVATDNQYAVEDMRRLNFSFKIINSSTHKGWLASNCLLEKYYMKLSALDVNGILEQTLVITTNSFVYRHDLYPQPASGKEEEDYKNLIAILKANQGKSAQEKNVVILPDASNACEQSVEQMDVKPKKKNKK